MGDNREIPRDIVFCGTLVHATDEDPMVLLENHCLGVVDGKVCAAFSYIFYYYCSIALQMEHCCCFFCNNIKSKMVILILIRKKIYLNQKP